MIMFPISDRFMCSLLLIIIICVNPSNSVFAPIHATQRYSYGDTKRPPTWRLPSVPMGTDITLDYSISPTVDAIDYLSIAEIRAAFERCFTRYSLVIPVYFREAAPDEMDYNVEIRIGFYDGMDHGFDGPLGVLARGGGGPYVGGSVIEFDLAERWAVDFKKEKSKNAFDLESEMMHELGHVMGLGHSDVKESIMFYRNNARTVKVNFNKDDIEGLRSLYGANSKYLLSSQPPVPPPENLSSKNINHLNLFMLISLLLLLVMIHH